MKPIALINDDFKDLLDYKKWLTEGFNNLSWLNENQASRFTEQSFQSVNKGTPNWFGKNTSYEELMKGVTEFARPELLDEIYNKVSQTIEPIVAQKLKARKLKFNSLGFGMFSFDRAAMTMFRNQEFFNTSKSETVDRENVKRIKSGLTDKRDNTKVIERWEQKPDGSPKIRTNTKELYAYFPEVPRDRHSVEFFLAAAGSASVKTEEMLYTGISAIIVTELLIMAGIKVKLNVVFGSAMNVERSKYVGCIIPVKQYDETLDRNLIALLTSDTRFTRWDMFKGLVATYDSFKEKVPVALGYPMNAQQIKTVLEKSGYIKKSKAQHRYYFGGIFSEEAALKDITETIEDIASHLHK